MFPLLLLPPVDDDVVAEAAPPRTPEISPHVPTTRRRLHAIDDSKLLVEVVAFECRWSLLLLLLTVI